MSTDNHFNADSTEFLLEALSKVRNMDFDDETINEGNETLNEYKVTGETGTGKASTNKSIKDKNVTKYLQTKETVDNINNGMSPKNALSAAMKKFAAGQGKHNPDIKGILSDLALNYPHMFNKHFRKEPLKVEEKEETEMSLDTLREGALEAVRSYLENTSGMEVTVEEAAEFMLETIEEEFE